MRKYVKILSELMRLSAVMDELIPNKSLDFFKKNFAIIIICLVGAILRFNQLNDIIFHLDEPMHTVKVAAESLSYNLTNDFASMLYQVMAHFLLPLGKLEFVSRLPAAVFGVLIILGTYYVGKLLLGKREGIIAALFVCFSHYLVNYSQYARAYTAFTFFSLLSLYFFFRALKGNKKKDWAFYLVFTIINIYTHLFTLVTVLTQISYVGILLLEKHLKFGKKKSWRMDKKRSINFIICTVLIVSISLLLRLPVQVGAFETSTTNFVANLLERIQKPPTIGIVSIIRQILTYQIYNFPSFLLFLALGFIIFGTVGCMIQLRKEDALLLVYVGLPILGFFLVKPRAVYFLVVDRYFIFTLPLIFILSAKGITFLSSFFGSIGSRLRIIKRIRVFQNILLTIFVAAFFLLECNTIKEYSDYVWKLRSLNLSKGVQSYLLNNACREEMVFFDFIPDKSKVLFITRLSLHNGEKRLMVHAANRMRLEKISNLKVGLWLVLDRHIFKERIANDPNFGLSEEIKEVDKYYLVHWRSDENPLIKNLIEMVEFLIPLHPDKGEEYRLLLAKFYFMDGEFDRALRELNPVENTQAVHPRMTEKSSHMLTHVRGLNKLIYTKNSRDLVFDSLHSDISRQLSYYGSKFLSEKQFDNAVSAFDLFLRYSDRDHGPIAKEYYSLGNLFLRLGKIDKAISSLRKAIQLDPLNYIYRLILAEAFKQNKELDRSIYEYKEIFKMPNLSEKLFYDLIQKPQIFAIWKDGKTWHCLWRSDKKCVFSGKLYFNKGIKKIQSHRFVKRDTLDRYKNHAIEFNVLANQGGIKALDIHVAKNSRLTCYVEINGQVVLDDIIFINSGENPSQIPFSVSAVGKNMSERIQKDVVPAEKARMPLEAP
jgi:tetratricopeptide (TPR) repeat protein